MSFNISEFRENLYVGLGRPANFEVTFTIPTAVTFASDVLRDVRNLTLKCFTAEVPGINLNTFEHRDYGLTHNIAYGKLYAEANFGLIMSADYREMRHFDEWMKFIYKDDTNNVAYYNDYIADITIKTFNEVGDESLVITLEEAYPKTINPIALSWEERDSFSRADVTMVYKKHKMGRVVEASPF